MDKVLKSAYYRFHGQSWMGMDIRSILDLNDTIEHIEKIGDGVYIYTENENLWCPQFWGLSTEIPKSVVLIQGDKSLCISLKGSKGKIMLLESYKEQTGRIFHIFPLDREAGEDWNGYQNTDELYKMGSPAAIYCKELGSN